MFPAVSNGLMVWLPLGSGASVLRCMSGPALRKSLPEGLLTGTDCARGLLSRDCLGERPRLYSL